MASILKVDTLQKPDGSTPTAADLGIDNGGSIINVYHINKTGHTNSASTSYIEIGLTKTITPVSANSKFYIHIILTGSTQGNAGTFGMLTRDNIPVILGDSVDGCRTVHGVSMYNSETNAAISIPMEAYDSPNTTSPITYAVKVANIENTTTWSINRPRSWTANSTYHATSVSSMTIYEIA